MSNLATYENCQMSLFDIVCHDLEDHVLQCDRDEEICTSCDVAQQIGDFLFIWFYSSMYTKIGKLPLRVHP